MNERKKKSLIIGALCCMLVFMGVGYAALSQILTVNGTGNVSGSWNIKITNIEVANNGTAKTATATSLGATPVNSDAVAATFSVELLQPGDYIEYDVTIQNKGTIDAVLNSVSFSTIGDTYIGFSVEPTIANLEGTQLTVAAPTNTKTIRVRAEFKNVDSMPATENHQLTTTLTLNYVQASAVPAPQPGGIEEGDNNGSSAAIQPLTYPMSGTIGDGVTYQLTSDGKVTLGGASTIKEEYDKESLRQLIIDDILSDYDEGYADFVMDDIKAIMRSGSTTAYSTTISNINGASDADLAELPYTRAELLAIEGIIQNVVPVTQLVFDDVVTSFSGGGTICMDGSTYTTFQIAGFDAITSISVPSTMTTVPCSGNANVIVRNS